MTKTKVEIPTSIKIGHKVFKVEMTPAIGQFRNLGFVKPKMGEMFLDSSQPVDELVDTVLHECLHVIWDQAYLEPGDSEERVISVLGTGMTTLFSRNPDLLSWIQEAQKNV